MLLLLMALVKSLAAASAMVLRVELAAASSSTRRSSSSSSGRGRARVMVEAAAAARGWGPRAGARTAPIVVAAVLIGPQHDRLFVFDVLWSGCENRIESITNQQRPEKKDLCILANE